MRTVRSRVKEETSRGGGCRWWFRMLAVGFLVAPRRSMGKESAESPAPSLDTVGGPVLAVRVEVALHDAARGRESADLPTPWWRCGDRAFSSSVVATVRSGWRLLQEGPKLVCEEAAEDVVIVFSQGQVSPLALATRPTPHTTYV